MKKIFLILITLMTIFLTGCGESSDSYSSGSSYTDSYSSDTSSNDDSTSIYGSCYCSTIINGDTYGTACCQATKDWCINVLAKDSKYYNWIPFSTDPNLCDKLDSQYWDGWKVQ